MSGIGPVFAAQAQAFVDERARVAAEKRAAETPSAGWYAAQSTFHGVAAANRFFQMPSRKRVRTERHPAISLKTGRRVA